MNQIRIPWPDALAGLVRQGRGWYRRQIARQQPQRSMAGAAEPLLVAGLADARPQVRWEAAAALGKNRQRSREALEALGRALADPEPFVRWQAAEALAAQEAGTVFPLLRSLLSDDEPLRRAGAAMALGCAGSEAACVELRQALADPDPEVRVAVADALGACGDPTAAPALAPLLADPDPEVRRAAATALGRVGNPSQASAVAEALARPGQPLLVRRALAATLAHIPHPEVQSRLLQALEDPDPQVRGYATQALAQVGNEQASAALAAARRDSGRLLRGTVGDQAARALALLERRGVQAPAARNGTSGEANGG